MPGEGIFFRTHNLLTTGDGTPALKWGSSNAYTEDQQGRAVYDWTILDRIFDTYLERGVKPYVEIGFMPKALSIKPEPYQHRWTPTAKYDEIYTGWSYPPKDYAKWAELVYQWAKHCGEKYGQAEVERWYWEVWNEANIGYWRGSREDFFKLHDYALDAVRRAIPRRGWAGRTWPAAIQNICGHFSNIACAARIMPPERSARRWISFHSTPRGSLSSSTGTCKWASPPN